MMNCMTSISIQWNANIVKTEFTKNNWRCMDHNHETGLFRKIVCHKCNMMDSYIKYPNGYSKQAYKQEYYQK